MGYRRGWDGYVEQVSDRLGENVVLATWFYLGHFKHYNNDDDDDDDDDKNIKAYVGYPSIVCLNFKVIRCHVHIHILFTNIWQYTVNGVK